MRKYPPQDSARKNHGLKTSANADSPSTAPVSTNMNKLARTVQSRWSSTFQSSINLTKVPLQIVCLVASISRPDKFDKQEVRAVDHDFTRSKAKLNAAKTIAKMLKMRSAIGADTPAGHRISNIDEIRQNRAKAEAEGDTVRLAHLDANLGVQLRDLERTRHPHS